MRKSESFNERSSCKNNGVHWSRIDPLKDAINDEDPYVRKTAAICIAKLYEINP